MCSLLVGYAFSVLFLFCQVLNIMIVHVLCSQGTCSMFYFLLNPNIGLVPCNVWNAVILEVVLDNEQFLNLHVGVS